MRNNPYIKKYSWLKDEKLTLSYLLSPLWNSMKHKINSMMYFGAETCPHASYAIAKELERLGLPAVVVGGEFNDSSHYWVETIWNSNKYIVDFGKNILASERNSDIIPIIVKQGAPFYKRYTMRDEAYYSAKQFLDAFGFNIVRFKVMRPIK